MKTAALAVVALVVVALAGTGLAGSGHTLAVKGPIQSISAAGGRVAIQAGEAGSCAAGASGGRLDAATGATVQLEGPLQQRLQLLGSHARGLDGDLVGLQRREPRLLRRRIHRFIVGPEGHGLGVCDGSEGDTYYELAGDTTIVAIADYSVCESDCTDANGKLLPDGDYGVEVRRVVGGKVKAVLPAVDFRRFLDAGNWRVAVVEPKNVLTVYDTSGKRVWKVAGVASVTGGWIAGSSVVVQRGRTVQVYSPAGAGPTRTLPRGAGVADVAGGLVVYTVGSSVHLLRLADGHDGRLVTVKGLVGAQITPAGVFYAVRTSVTFVPLSVALRSLA